MKLYIPARNAFLKANPVCQCGDCQKKAVDLHHKRGRTGLLLLDQRHWMSVCRPHHNWIRDNTEEARKLGWLCEYGLWNTSDRS